MKLQLRNSARFSAPPATSEKTGLEHITSISYACTYRISLAYLIPALSLWKKHG